MHDPVGVRSPGDAFEAELARVGGLSVGIMSATQGSYTTEQLLLDITQGARVVASAYEQRRPPALRVVPDAGGAIVAGWGRVRRRAEGAPQLLRPGLLATTIPGGGAYAGIAGRPLLDAVAAAGRDGRIAAVSLGTPSSLLTRIAALGRRSRFVVADLPGGAAGYADLRALSADRSAARVLIVLERPGGQAGAELLWAAVAGLPGGGGRELSSQTTNERGLLASVDLGPTILRALGIGPVPADMRGLPVHDDGILDSLSLRALLARLRVIGARRLEALGFLLCALALALLTCAQRPPLRARAVRAGALGILWAPLASLIPAALEPSAPVEYATIALACLALGALTDALVAWPRAPLLPAAVTVAVLVADALAGTQLLTRSLLGPDPALGARFYGIGNELKSGLAVLVFAAVAAALYPAARGHRAAAAMAAATIALAVVEGAARIGAGVGGVILVSAGGAVATVLLLPAARGDRRTVGKRGVLILMSPVLALIALAGIDLLTAHGSGHFTGSVLDARSASDVRDIIVRRYRAAFAELTNHAMPFAAALALALGAWGAAAQRRLLGPVANDRAWAAALAGGLTAGVVGALSEDSGPELLVIAVFTLGSVLAYIWGGSAAQARTLAAR